VRPIRQKRESAKDERRNDARELGVHEMRAQRAHHEGANSQRSGSSPPWNQYTDPVTFDHSLDVVVSRLRAVLGDKGPSPRYIETVPRRGYRFTEPVTTTLEARPANAPRQWRRRLVTYAAVAILAAIMAIAFARTRYEKFVPPPQRSAPSPAVPAS
jgi:hypothetical protein